MPCRLERFGLRRRLRLRGEVDVEDHGAVLMAEYRRRTQAQGVREESSLAHSRAHVRVHRSQGAPRNAGRAPRAGREACPAAAKREPRPQRVARSRRGLTSHGCIRRRLGTANLRACRPAPQPAQTMRWTRLRLLTAWEALQGRSGESALLGQHCVGATDFDRNCHSASAQATHNAYLSPHGLIEGWMVVIAGSSPCARTQLLTVRFD